MWDDGKEVRDTEQVKKKVREAEGDINETENRYGVTGMHRGEEEGKRKGETVRKREKRKRRLKERKGRTLRKMEAGN